MNILNGLKTKASRCLLKAKKYTPEICVISGIAVGCYALYTACKETLKIEDILDETKQKLEMVHNNEPDEDGEEKLEGYSKKNAAKDKTMVYIQTICKLAKNYAPAAGLCLVSLALILGGFGILKKRHIALTTAYSGLSESYKKYRETIASKYGKDVDMKSLLGVEEKIKTTEEEDEKGNRTVKEETGISVKHKPSDDSDYVVLFSENTARSWKSQADFNHGFLISTERYCNQLLHTRGHLFLNEVYDALGMKHTTTGALCGWVLNDAGDNFVSFGINEYHDGKNRLVTEDAMGFQPYGRDADFWLEFNCQGTIYDKI